MADSSVYRNALPTGSMLLEYRLESVLGAGSFGMTYLGWDTHLEKHVAIKEYLPTDLAVRALDGSVVPINTENEHHYQWGLERFILEARTLAKFSHPHIVRVNRYFEANSTGYMVMDYEKGESLNQMLKRAGQLDEAQLKAILMPLLDGLQAVHEIGFLHRDIKPSNIFIRENGVPVLLDFGAARQVIGATKSLTSVLTPGYAPLEQYSSGGRQGPWSDIYALSGVLYRAIVNESPPDAVSRLRGDIVPEKLALSRGRYSASFLAAIEWAMALNEKQRPQSILEWKRSVAGEQPVPAVSRTPAPAVVAAGVSPDAPTVLLTQPEPAQPLDETQRPTRMEPVAERAKRSRARWPWVGVVLGIIIAVGVTVAWTKQRAAQRMAQTPASEAVPVKPVPPSSAEAGRPKPAVTQRERFDRDRERAQRERKQEQAEERAERERERAEQERERAEERAERERDRRGRGRGRGER